MFLTVMSRSRLIAEGIPRINQMCATGAASEMWPMRSRRVIERVTRLPSLSTAASRERMQTRVPAKTVADPFKKGHCLSLPFAFDIQDKGKRRSVLRIPKKTRFSEKRVFCRKTACNGNGFVIESERNFRRSRFSG